MALNPAPGCTWSTLYPMPLVLPSRSMTCNTPLVAGLLDIVRQIPLVLAFTVTYAFCNNAGLNKAASALLRCTIA